MKTLIKIALPILLIVGAYLGAKAMISSKPPLESKLPPVISPKVQALSLSPDTFSPPVTSFGNVQSYFETTLSPQVAGSITSVSDVFRVGNKVSKGTLLAQIDNTDYIAALSRSSATVATNTRLLAEEEIRATQAKEDWLASGRALSSASDFVLRKPQLAAAKANLESSEAALQKAKTDVERCKIIAPFDAIVSQRRASVGNFATAQTSLGSLVSTERAEVRLPLTPDQSQRIQLPTDANSATQITLSSPTKANHSWTATLSRTEPVIDPQNQVLYVIAEIDSPFNAEAPLAIGSFVNASIPSAPIKNVLELPEAAIVNDTFLWIIDEESKLQKAPIQRIYSFNGKAYVRVISEAATPPFSVISRPLTNFRTGMKVSNENAPQ